LLLVEYHRTLALGGGQEVVWKLVESLLSPSLTLVSWGEIQIKRRGGSLFIAV
jgi:hypothetical protein